MNAMITPGEILKNKRKSLGKTVFEVSQETRILEKYIKQLESNQFGEFDSPVFARGFIKIYADYLGLEVEKVLALFRRENKKTDDGKTKKRKTNIFSKLDGGNFTKNLLIGFSIFIFLLFGGFLYYQLYLYQLKPSLDVFSPVNGLTTQEKEISIEGITNKNTKVFLNNNEIANNNGTFKQNYTLTTGENILTIQSINLKNTTRKTEKIIKVYYEEKKVVETEKPLRESFSIQLKVKSEATWVKLIVDQRQKLAQVLEGGFTQKFKVTKEFEVVTGRPDQTEIYIDNVKRVLKINSETGVASLNCKLENVEVICSE